MEQRKDVENSELKKSNVEEYAGIKTQQKDYFSSAVPSVGGRKK